MTYYLSGPITGKPEGNLRAFLAAREVLYRRGNGAIIPHEICEPITATPHAQACPAYLWCACMVALLPLVGQVDAVMMLPGWKASRGARRERYYALERGIEVVEAESWG